MGRELELVDEQIERMRLIVTQLLQFARPAEYAGYVEAVDTNRLVQDSLVLAQHLLARSHIKVTSSLAATGLPKGNRNELQQVLVNLLVNAIHAMPDGGVLSLATQDHRRDGQAWVEVSVARHRPLGWLPSCCATCSSHLSRGKKDGTGLGLWISRNIVDRYGGDLRVAPRSDGSAGAVFSVWLRVDPA